MNQPGAVTVGLASMLRAPSLQPSKAAKLREASKIRTRSRVKGLVIFVLSTPKRLLAENWHQSFSGEVLRLHCRLESTPSMELFGNLGSPEISPSVLNFFLFSLLPSVLGHLLKVLLLDEVVNFSPLRE